MSAVSGPWITVRAARRYSDLLVLFILATSPVTERWCTVLLPTTGKYDAGVILNDASLTSILNGMRGGDRDAMRRAVPMVYEELHALAGAVFDRRQAGQTLQPTALVNEAFLKLSDEIETAWKSREHFYAVAAKVMRQVLADHARARGAQKRGGEWKRITMTGIPGEPNGPGGPAQDVGVDLIELNAALDELSSLQPRHAEIVELRFLAGLPIDEVAVIIGTSRRTVERDWRIARAWLRDRLAS